MKHVKLKKYIDGQERTKYSYTYNGGGLEPLLFVLKNFKRKARQYNLNVDNRFECVQELLDDNAMTKWESIIYNEQGL